MQIAKMAVTEALLDPSVDQVIREVGRFVPLDDEQEFRIRLVSTELLNNVVLYSGASSIEMRADLDANVLTLVIDDDGEGFEYGELLERDVTQEEYLTDEHGRGIFLVRMMSDGFRYNDKGNSVEVTLKLA